ncbi:MAG: VWA domain-containing protein [Proteobacteria bacterium]|nr:VWA domain-containing protein [Pseudomonadota bacterium]
MSILFFQYRKLFFSCSLCLILIIFIISTPGKIFAASNPGYLDASIDNIAAGSNTYRFWYSEDCNTGLNCECDIFDDTDTNGDGIDDADSDNDCMVSTDSNSDGIFDTGPDNDGDGILDVVDVDWVAGGAGVVESVPFSVQRTLDRYENDWNLKAPKWNTTTNRNIYIYNIPYLGVAYRNGSGVELDTDWMLSQGPEPRGTVLHELWHMTQYKYQVSAGGWLMDGQARMLQDKVFDDLDNRVGSRYHNSVSSYLGNTTWATKEDRDNDNVPEFDQATGLLGATYNASLWWTYLADQAGTQYGGTAGDGMDFLIDVLKAADDDGRQGKDAVNHLLHTRIDQGFDDTFWDFTVANYAKNFDLSMLHHDYLGGRDPETVLKYSDENRTAPDILIYGDQYTDAITGVTRGVERSTFNVSALITGVNGRVNGMSTAISNPDAMSAYGANYYEGMIDSDKCMLGYFRVIGDDNARFMFSWLLVKEDSNGDGDEEVVSLLRTEGKAFARAVWNPQGTAGIYTRMVGIIATGENPYGYDWEMGCTEPEIQIVNPRKENPAYVGAPDEPGRFLLWLRVTGATGTSTYVAGLEWNRDFSVNVGGALCDVLNGGYVQDQYWLVVQAPEIPSASIGDKFAVRVELGPMGSGIVDIEEEAVIYDIHASDQILVIDRSGSMGDYAKLESAKTAARLFTDVKQKFDQLGVVSFTNDANEEYPLTLIPDQDDHAGIRADAQERIDDITDANRTSVGDGLKKGQDMLDADGDPDHQWVMVLLSDGMENEPVYWNDVQSDIVNAGTKVHAIALGQDADEELMREIAETTCGDVWVDECYNFIEESGTADRSDTAKALSSGSLSLPNALADIYRRTEESIAGHQRLWQNSGSLSARQTFDIEINEDGVRDAFFSFNWSDKNTPMDVSISGPSGVSFIKLTDKKTHMVFYAKTVLPGVYRITMKPLAGTVEWVGSLSGRLVYGTELYAFIDNTRIQRLPGLPVGLQAMLTDNKGPVTGATVTAQVRHPDGDIDQVLLVDDGGPYDDLKNDGIYSYVYDRINRPLEANILRGHSWTIDISANGENNSGRQFERYKRLTYTPYIGRDQKDLDGDKDGMLDVWENRFKAVKPTDAGDAGNDYDHDGLSNIEEFELGTNPDDPDTDNGGELDGSEVKKGQNPLLTKDDTIPPVSDFWVENLPGAVTLHFNPRSEYQEMRVYRRTGSIGFFNLIGSFDPSKGEITDKKLVNNTNYFYYMQPIGLSDAAGSNTPIRYAKPARDPYKPEGMVLINNDDLYTHSTTVTVTFSGLTLPDGNPDIRYIQIANSTDLSSAAFIPFTHKLSWTIDPEPETGLACIYVRFLDAAGNLSDAIYGDCIIYRPISFLPAGLLEFWRVTADFRDPVFSGLTFRFQQTSTPTLSPYGQDLFFAGTGFQLWATDKLGRPVTEFDKSFMIVVSYEDWQWRDAGIRDEASLNLYYKSGKKWMPILPCYRCKHDTEKNKIIVYLDHLTEFALMGPPKDPDTDIDTISDVWEMTHFNSLETANKTSDYDADGLLDKDEYLRNTNPKNRDTDDDGMPDGWEAEHLLNPLVKDSNLDTDNDGHSNGKEYQANTDPNNRLSYPLIITVPLSLGYNLISEPTNTHFMTDAFTFLSETPGTGIEKIRHYNRDNKNIEVAFFIAGGEISGENFLLTGGQGMAIETSNPMEIELFQNECPSINLLPGINWIGTPCEPNHNSAFALLLSIGDESIVISVQRYNPQTGAFETACYHEGVILGTDFPIKAGEGYMLNMRKSITGFRP